MLQFHTQSLQSTVHKALHSDHRLCTRPHTPSLISHQGFSFLPTLNPNFVNVISWIKLIEVSPSFFIINDSFPFFWLLNSKGKHRWEIVKRKRKQEKKGRRKGRKGRERKNQWDLFKNVITFWALNTVIGVFIVKISSSRNFELFQQFFFAVHWKV